MVRKRIVGRYCSKCGSELSDAATRCVRCGAPVDDLEDAPTLVDRVVTPEQLTAMRAEFEKNRAVTSSPLDEVPRNTIAIPRPVALPFETQPITIRPPEPAATQSDPPPTLIIPMPPEVSQPIRSAAPEAVAPPSTIPEAPIAGPATESQPVRPRRQHRILWGVIALVSLIAAALAATVLLKPEPRPVVTETRPTPRPQPQPVNPPPVVTPPVVTPPAVATETVAPAPVEVIETPPPIVEKRPTPPRRRTPAQSVAAVPETKAPPAVQEGELAKLGDAGVIPPQLSQDVEPKVPVRARMAGAGGRVELSLLIDHRGNVEEVRVAESSGNVTLDNAAKAAATKSRFRPATKNGVAVRMWITRNYNFRR